MELKNGVLQYSECSMYKLNYSDIAKSYRTLDDIALKQSTAEIVPCTKGWNYNRNIYKNTVVTEVSNIFYLMV